MCTTARGRRPSISIIENGHLCASARAISHHVPCLDEQTSRGVVSNRRGVIGQNSLILENFVQTQIDDCLFVVHRCSPERCHLDARAPRRQRLRRCHPKEIRRTTGAKVDECDATTEKSTPFAPEWCFSANKFLDPGSGVENHQPRVGTRMRLVHRLGDCSNQLATRLACKTYIVLPSRSNIEYRIPPRAPVHCLRLRRLLH